MSWESLFLFDLTIFSLTLFKTLQARRRNPVTIGRNDILSLVMRDGSSSQPHVFFALLTFTAPGALYFAYASHMALRRSLSTH